MHAVCHNPEGFTSRDGSLTKRLLRPRHPFALCGAFPSPARSTGKAGLCPPREPRSWARSHRRTRVHSVRCTSPHMDMELSSLGAPGHTLVMSYTCTANVRPAGPGENYLGEHSHKLCTALFAGVGNGLHQAQVPSKQRRGFDLDLSKRLDSVVAQKCWCAFRLGCACLMVHLARP